MCKLSKKELDAINKEFQEIQSHYLENNDKNSWDKMFSFVCFAIENAVKKQLKGINRCDIYDLIMDATCNVMQRYLRPQSYNIQSLPSVAHFAALNIVRNEKQVFYDKMYSLDEFLERKPE